MSHLCLACSLTVQDRIITFTLRSVLCSLKLMSNTGKASCMLTHLAPYVGRFMCMSWKGMFTC